MGISCRHPLRPEFLPLCHVYWQHELPPPADPPWYPLRCAVCALLFFSSVYSTFFRCIGGLYALRVNNCVAWTWVPPCVCPHPFHQRRADFLPKPAPDHGVIKIGHGCMVESRGADFAICSRYPRNTVLRLSIPAFPICSCFLLAGAAV